MNQIGVALVGCGMVADTHLMALREIPMAKICGVWNRTPETMIEFAKKYSINIYQSYQELLADPQVNTVIIALPPALHVDYGLRAVSAGKNVILEKPIDIDPEKARRLITECRRSNLKLAVIFQNRYTAAAQKVKEALDQGVLGRIILADAYVKWYRSPEYYQSSAWRGTWEVEGGGALITQAIHTIDLIQWFMGGAASVYGRIKTAFHKINTEDLGVAIVEYKNGALGVIEGSTAVAPGFKERIELHGEKGTIVLEGGNIKEWKVEGDQESRYVATEKVSYGDSNSPAISYVNHQAQLAETFQAFLRNEEPLVNGEEGLKSLEIVKAIYASSKSGQKITL